MKVNVKVWDLELAQSIRSNFCNIDGISRPEVIIKKYLYDKDHIYEKKMNELKPQKTLKLQHREGFEVRSPILQPAGDLLVPRGRG